jgi:chitin synthase
MNLKYQKYIIICILLGINILLATTFIVYKNKWYAYLFILALASSLNSFSCLFIMGHKMLYGDGDGNNINPRLFTKNYIYIVPCYTETKEELIKTLNSLILQRKVENDKRLILIICDGTSLNKNNICDKVLRDILDLNTINSKYYSYSTWDQKENLIQIYKSYYSHLNESLPVILLIKMENYGKRDSLVLVRSLCYDYNQSLLLNSESIVDASGTMMQSPNPLTLEMLNNLNFVYSGEEIHYIIGIDADTAFDYNCSYELIQSMQASSDIHGCVGYVDISREMNFYSPFVLYQYAEYMFAQCLRRHAQSRITQKVNCLSGCVQILRISNETSGSKILKTFNYLPAPEESIFNHIRSYASEDRNHVCNLLSLYPQAKTVQNLRAIAYTIVPTNWWVFLSQRRRWSLGANANDMLLVYLPDIIFVERISAFINVFTYSLSPFISIATILFIKAIIVEPTMLMLYLSSFIFVPFFYAFFIVPIFVKPLSFKNTLYYYLSYICFISMASIVNLIIYMYSIFCMDVIKWGKTRQLKNNSDEYIFDDTIYDTIDDTTIDVTIIDDTTIDVTIIDDTTVDDTTVDDTTIDTNKTIDNIFWLTDDDPL